MGASCAHLAFLAAFVVALGGFVGVLERSGNDLGTFWARFEVVLEAQDSNFQGFFVQGCRHFQHALNATKPQLYWVQTHFASNALDARNDKKSLLEPCAYSVVPQSVPWDAQGYYWGALGSHLGALGALLARFWALLGPKKPVLGRSWVPSKRVLDALGRLFAASWLTWAPPGLIWVGFRSLGASILKGLVACKIRFIEAFWC